MSEMEIINELVKKVAVIEMEPTEINGVKFRLGLIGKMPLPFSICVTGAIFPDGVMPLIIFSAGDIQKFMTNYGEDDTKDFVTFALSHEIGHLIDFTANPPGAGYVNDNRREAVADSYAIAVGGRNKYRKFMKTLVDETLSRCKKGFSAIIGRLAIKCIFYQREQMALKMEEGGIDCDIVSAKMNLIVDTARDMVVL